ncbi:MAG: hypothetical protein P4L90_27855 [Rhodopila sp.]|nr:hypothetical protein [Rhodopila sp.]
MNGCDAISLWSRRLRLPDQAVPDMFCQPIGSGGRLNAVLGVPRAASIIPMGL